MAERTMLLQGPAATWRVGGDLEFARALARSEALKSKLWLDARGRRLRREGSLFASGPHASLHKPAA